LKQANRGRWADGSPPDEVAPSQLAQPPPSLNVKRGKLQSADFESDPLTFLHLQAQSPSQWTEEKEPLEGGL